MSKSDSDSCPRHEERRRALKILGAGLLGLAALSGGCTSNPGKPGERKRLSLPPSVPAPAPAQHADTSKMTYRVNPRNGDKISVLGFGCMRFPTIPHPEDSSVSIIDEENAYKLVDYAWSHGINYYDTAYFYHDGASEAMIGKALARYPRQSFYLADKMPTRIIESLDQAKSIFEDQLFKCQVMYFDYYLLHNLSDLASTKHVYEELGVLDYLIEQKKQGRIRNLGWSFHGDRELFLYALDKLGYDWDFVQIQFNYNDWEFGDAAHHSESIPAQWMYEELKKRHLGFVIMEPLLGGRLAKLNRSAVNIFKAANPDVSVASWALRYAVDPPEVICALSGMTYMEHLMDNVTTVSPFKPLSTQERQVIARALEAFRADFNIPCTGCNYCMPCPYGVNIPAVFSHHNKCVAEERLPDDSEDPEYKRMRREYLIGYNRMANPLQQASRCIGCGKCVPSCPQKLNIPVLMNQIHELTESLLTKARTNNGSPAHKIGGQNPHGRR